jgi:hypothetical protein
LLRDAAQCSNDADFGVKLELENFHFGYGNFFTVSFEIFTSTLFPSCNEKVIETPMGIIILLWK